MRDFLNKFGVPIFVAVLVIAAALIALNLRSHTSLSGNPSLRYYINEETGEESVHSANEIPPLMGENGKPTVVQEITYTCDGGKTRHILYLRKLSEEALAKLSALAPDDHERPNVIDAGEEIRDPARGSPWMSVQDPEASKLLILPTCPDGKPAIYVYPQK